MTGHTDYSACAYTGKVARFSAMMRSLGHDVIHYGAEGSTLDCTEHVTVISAAEQRQFFGELAREKSFPIKWDPREPYWQLANTRAADAINARKQPRDFLCLVGGNCQQQIAEIVTEREVIACEPFVGYYGIFSRFRVFESYTHQSCVYGTRSRDPNGCLYDAVIPNYYDPADFPPGDFRDDYLLYIGRLINRKGLAIVLDLAKRTGRRLVLAGQGVKEQTDDKLVTEEGVEIPLGKQIRYAGTVAPADRAQLMGRAHAVVMPTLFMEPFGGVNVEAQLCGTPVITTDHAAFFETVEHGFSGYRCHTLEQFAWAVENTHLLASREAIRARAVAKWSTDRVRHMYQEWFEMLYALWDEGWYSARTDRTDLDWLRSPRAT